MKKDDAKYVELHSKTSELYGIDEHQVQSNTTRKVIVITVGFFCVLLVALIPILLTRKKSDNNSNNTPQIIGCDHPIYCTGDLLKAVQTAHLFSDCKTFVDMPSLWPPDTILKKYNEQKGESAFDLKTFIAKYFDPPGSELLGNSPADFEPNATALTAKIASNELKKFALGVHSKWQNLFRIRIEKYCSECSSLLPIKTQFVIPGGRFREFYYWDSFWIIKGLLVSGMHYSAKLAITNILDIIDEIGLMPNGARIYYKDRSQLPLATQMVAEYVKYEMASNGGQMTQNATDLIKRALPTLDKEHDFFQSTHSVSIALNSSALLTLNRFFSITDAPRPESFLEDYTTAMNAPARHPSDVYSDLAAGAETGWDYCTRWLADGSNMSTIRTTDIVPADLNAVMLMNEETIGQWFDQYGEQPQKKKEYDDVASARADAMFQLLWNATSASFFDYIISEQKHNTNWYPSNYVPLLSSTLFSRLSDEDLGKIVGQLGGNLKEGGFPGSQLNTGQQWDYPNGWPPLQWFLVEGLEAVALKNITSGGTSATAATVRKNAISYWIRTNYCGFQWVDPETQNTNLMFEKYNVTLIGVPGGGGEYPVQIDPDGFGWTNGVALYFLDREGSWLTTPACN